MSGEERTTRMSRLDEERVAEHLRFLGLDTRRFGKEEMMQRTPDFRLYDSAGLAGFCEVKSSTPLPEGVGPDPTFNRTSSDIHQASEQLHSVNPSREAINVLAFVNHEAAIDERDLYAVFTGNFYSTRGVAYPIYRKYSHGRIKAEKTLIDVYLWFQTDEPQPSTLFNMSDGERFIRACSLFRADPDDLFHHN